MSLVVKRAAPQPRARVSAGRGKVAGDWFNPQMNPDAELEDKRGRFSSPQHVASTIR